LKTDGRSCGHRPAAVGSEGRADGFALRDRHEAQIGVIGWRHEMHVEGHRRSWRRSRSAIIAADSAKTSLSRRTFGKAGGLGSCEEAIGFGWLVCTTHRSSVPPISVMAVRDLSTRRRSAEPPCRPYLVMPGWATAAEDRLELPFFTAFRMRSSLPVVECCLR